MAVQVAGVVRTDLRMAERLTPHVETVHAPAEGVDWQMGFLRRRMDAKSAGKIGRGGEHVQPAKLLGDHLVDELA
eukprot:2350629-Pleurochrysis_carterae.AAC.1